jgi:hypothetical protein
VVSGDTATISVVITDFAGMVIFTAPVKKRAYRILERLGRLLLCPWHNNKPDHRRSEDDDCYE